MANLKDLLVNGPSNLIGDVTVNKIRLTSLAIPSNNGTNDDMGSNGQVLKSNGTSVYWANDNNTTSFTITANATDGLWDLTGTNGTNSVTYALAPYSSKRTVASFYTGTTNPTLTTRLNYDGYLYAKKLYSDGAETITKNGGIINNSLTLQKSSTSPDSPELIFNGQAGNSDAYKWSIQKNSSGDLIFSKINSNNISTITTVFSANGQVGIGTLEPQELLEINGNICANNIYPKNSNNNNNYSSYDLGKTNARWNKLYVNEFAPDEEYSAINIQFSNVWQDLKDSSDNLIHLSKSGTYIVQIYDDSHNDGASGHYQTYWSGIFSWYAGGVNGSGEYTEISLHGAGHAMNKKSIQLRTCSPLSSTMKFQIKGNRSTSTNNAKNTISIKFKFIM